MNIKKIGFIGYRGHATRLIRIFSGMKGCEVSHLYHPEKDIDIEQVPVPDRSKLTATRRLDDLYSCDAIVISTPNHTHFGYLKKLREDYKGYIFCEKPPVSSLKELEALARFPDGDKKRTYFNFNMRFGFLNEILRTFPQKYDLGEPLRISIIVGHGLALKESYKSSWRAKKDRHKTGILETVGIHFLDLISFLFGQPRGISYKGENHSPYGDSIDTCHLACSFENRCHLSLTCSYCIPFTQHIELHYTNGIMDFDSGKIRVFGPRETFDKNGFFIQPPLIHEAAADINGLYLQSLEDSCRYFADCISNRRDIDLKYFDQSVLSNRLCLSTADR
jgi:predicted dehydrogenase